MARPARISDVPTGKQSVTIRLDRSTVEHFKRIAAQTGIRYQTLINLYLRDCADTGRRPDLRWERPRHTRQ